MIKKFNYMTPGREENAGEIKLYTRQDVDAQKKGAEGAKGGNSDDALSAEIVRGLGGKDNISDVDCCITRLRCTVKDGAKVDQAVLKATGASGVIVAGKGVQIVYGPRVSVIRSNVESYLANYQEPAAVEAKTEAAPAVTMVFDTKHAFTIQTDGGLEVLVHMGIDTVQLQGKPFMLTIRQGDKVRCGDLIGTMDRKAIQDAGYRTITPVVVGNVDDFDTCQLVQEGQVEHGANVLDVH